MGLPCDCCLGREQDSPDDHLRIAYLGHSSSSSISSAVIRAGLSPIVVSAIAVELTVLEYPAHLAASHLALGRRTYFSVSEFCVALHA
jgi:hypothetical protein